MKTRSYIVKKKLLNIIKYQNCIFDTIKLARDDIFQFDKDLCWVREQNVSVFVVLSYKKVYGFDPQVNKALVPFIDLNGLYSLIL